LLYEMLIVGGVLQSKGCRHSIQIRLWERVTKATRTYAVSYFVGWTYSASRLHDSNFAQMPFPFGVMVQWKD